MKLLLATSICTKLELGDTGVTTLQAVANCYSRTGVNFGFVSPSDMTQALEYFNLPDDMWPSGLLMQHRVTARYDIWAAEIMRVVNPDLLKHTNYLSTTETSYEYCLKQDEHGISLCNRKHANLITEIPALLMTRLDCLAKAQYIYIEYPSGYMRFNCNCSFRIKPRAMV